MNNAIVLVRNATVAKGNDLNVPQNNPVLTSITMSSGLCCFSYVMSCARFIFFCPASSLNESGFSIFNL